jgi:FdhE protein
MESLTVIPLTLEAWGKRRRRVRRLRERYPFAGQLLTLYGALLDVQERAFLATREDRPEPADLARYVADHVLAEVVRVTGAEGPRSLAEASTARLEAGDLVGLVRRWLAGGSQPAVDDYLARAAAGPVLEALGPDAGAACPAPGRAGHCPRCGGRPQLAYVIDSSDALVTAPRSLLCCRCGASWIHERMACPSCGERSTAKLPIYAEGERFPHVRADACESCRRYLLSIDLRKEPEAVPVVDELAALPLDLYVQECGFTKVVPNLMGIG